MEVAMEAAMEVATEVAMEAPVKRLHPEDAAMTGRIAPRPTAALVVLCAAVFMAALDMFIVNVALVNIGEDYGRGSLADLSWILNGYTILYGALLVPAGRLADRFGKKQAFLVGLAVFTLASVACAASPGLWSLVAFRGLQAAGGAVLTPASLGLVLTVLPAASRSRSVRIWTASSALAGAVGPVLGGLFIAASWRWIFLVNLPIGVAACIAAARFIPAVPREPSPRWPDLLGGLLLVLAIGALVLGLVEVPELGWWSPVTGACWAIGAAALAGFLHRSARHPAPIVDLAMFRHGPFAWANATMLLASVAFAIELVSIVLLLQDRWRWSVLATGLAIAPGPCMVPIFAVAGQRLARRFPAGTVAALGAGALGAGALLFATIGSRSYAGGALPAWLLCGAGVGLTFPSIFAAATLGLPAHQASTGSAVVNMSRQLGMALGTSVLVVISGLAAAAGASNPLSGGWWFAAGAAVIGGLAALRMTPRAALARALERT